MAADVTNTRLMVSAPAEPRSVPLLRREVEDFLTAQGACRNRVADIRLAVSEAVSNAVLHAYAGADGSVELRATRGDRTVEVVVSDHGRGLVPRDDSPGLGLGLRVIARLSDAIEIARVGHAGGTDVRMRFDC